ncbi:DUF1758 domain-containing protein [Trichonephila clavipes]|nr:DUF1758 domain-containing protein [Trichonephila clavipes]
MKFLEKRSAVLENIARIPSTKMIHKNTAMSTKAKSLVVNSKKIIVKPCILCRNSHPLYKCIAFQNMSVECRKKFVSNNKLCINCLRLHSGACMSKYKCTVSGCKGLHHSLLHDSDELCSAVKNHTVGERGIETKSNTTRFEGQPEVVVLTYVNKCVLLNTFMIFVKSADGYRIKLRGLLDNASMTCVMREDIARKLGFKFRSANQSITGINGITQASKYSENIEVSNRDYTFARNVQFSSLPKITDAIPVSKLNISDLNIPASSHMEEIKNETLDKINYYIPHHSVYKPEKTSTPLRVVFDASAKTTSGFSLNSILLNGGIIQQDLFSIVSRFRKHECSSQDVQTSYRNLWDSFCTFLATRTSKTLANEEKVEFPDAADAICNDSYMDDILSGESTLEGAKKLQTRLSQLLQRGGFELNKNGCQKAQNC